MLPQHPRYEFEQAKTVQKHELKLYRCSSNMWSPVIMRKVGGSIYIKWITIFNEDRSKVGVRIFSPFSGGWMDPDVFLILDSPMIKVRDLENRIRDRMAKQKVISGRREVRNAFGYHPNKLLDLAVHQEYESAPVNHQEARGP